MKTNLKGKITLEIVLSYMEENNLSVSETIDAIQKNSDEYPERPIKPYLTKKHSLDDVKLYTEKLQRYEESLPEYKKINDEYHKYFNDRNSVIENFIKTESCLYNNVPEKYQKKVYSLSYSNGHSGGYNEIYNNLVDIIEIFE